MTSLLHKAFGFWRQAAVLFGKWGDTAPIDSVATLEDFVATRSAYVAQKTLYGYVKTRMGTRYPVMFEDANIVASLNIARAHVFAACLSDLTLYTVVAALPDAANDDRAALARHCYAQALRQNIGAAPAEFSSDAAIDEFGQRLVEIDWHLARQPEIFNRSPRALVKWAPIAEKLKKLDSEVVENSVKFAWRDVREQFNKRLAAGAVGADWARQPAG
jgi:hypothetical protein